MTADILPFPAPPAGPRCPLCGRPAEPRHRPFCSRRCAEIDLKRWLDGDYRIPGPEADIPEAPDDPDGA